MNILLSIKWKTNPLCIQIALFHLPKHPPVPVCLDSDFLLCQKLQYLYVTLIYTVFTTMESLNVAILWSLDSEG